MVRELGSKRRETVWSLSAVRVRNLRGRIPSKFLLLRGVIRDDNSANNGGILNNSASVDNHDYVRSFNHGTIYLRTRIN